MTRDQIQKSFKKGNILRMIINSIALLILVAITIVCIYFLISLFPERFGGGNYLVMVFMGYTAVLFILPVLIISLKRTKIQKNYTARIVAKFFLIVTIISIIPLIGYTIAATINKFMDFQNTIIVICLAILIVLMSILFIILRAKTKTMALFYRTTRDKYKEIVSSNLRTSRQNELIADLQEKYNQFDYVGIQNIVINDIASDNIETQAAISTYDANFFSRTIHAIGRGLLLLITLGIAYPFTKCMKISYEVKHTKYDGRQLYFDGNGAQLIGKWILWQLLCIPTIGIFAFFIPNRITKWVTKHTHIKGEESSDSYYNGLLLSRLGLAVLSFFLSLCTLFILYPYAKCLKLRYKASHTYYDGQRLVFTAPWTLLLGKWVLWLLLCIPTIGIFALFIPGRLKRFIIKYTHYELPNSKTDKAINNSIVKFNYGNNKNIVGYITAGIKLVLPFAATLLIFSFESAYFTNINSPSKLKKMFGDYYSMLVDEFNAKKIDDNTFQVVNGRDTITFYYVNNTMRYIELNTNQNTMANKAIKVLNCLSPTNEFTDDIIYEIYYQDGSYLLARCLDFDMELSSTGYDISFLDVYSNKQNIKADYSYGNLVETIKMNTIIAKIYEPEYSPFSNNVLEITGTGNFTGLPEEYNDYGFDIIVKEGITGISNLPHTKNIILPESLTYIGKNAINYLTSDKLTIPANVKTIAEGAFYQLTLDTLEFKCVVTDFSNMFRQSSIKEIIIPDNTTSFTKGVLSGIGGVTKLVIPFIGSNINNQSSLDFLGCDVSSLETLVLTAPNIVIGSKTFNATNRLKNIYIMGANVKITEYALADLKLRNLTISNNTILTANMLAGTIIENFVIDNSVNTIEENCFNNAYITNLTLPFVGNDKLDAKPLSYLGLRSNNLTTVTLTNALTISSNFLDNYNLITEINLNEGLETIEDYAFSNSYATKLKSLTLPGTIKHIASQAFSNSHITSFSYNGKREDWLLIDNESDYLQTLFENNRINFLKE